MLMRHPSILLGLHCSCTMTCSESVSGKVHILQICGRKFELQLLRPKELDANRFHSLEGNSCGISICVCCLHKMALSEDLLLCNLNKSDCLVGLSLAVGNLVLALKSGKAAATGGVAQQLGTTMLLIALLVRLAWLAGALSLRSSAKVPSDHLSSLWT